MAMTRKTLEEARAEAERFLEACQNVLIDLDMELEWDGYRRRDEPAEPTPQDRPSRNYKNSGALRRASMDLTRKLAELRKSPYES